MCDIQEQDNKKSGLGTKIVPVSEAVGTVLSHDITEIRPGEFKGRAFKKGHIVRDEDVAHLQRLGKENLFILEIKDDEVHENDAAYAIAKALAGSGVKLKGEPSEGKINIVAERDGLLKVNHEALLDFNVEDAVNIAEKAGGVLSVTEIRKPKAGIVITGNEVYHGKIKDAFEPVITKKIKKLEGEVIGVHFAPDNAQFIENKIRELIGAGADLIITTGGMSVDPDDVTRFAIRNLGVEDLFYGSPVLPGSMFLVAYISGEAGKRGSGEVKGNKTSGLIPILGIPACGMYSSITVFDLVLPRVLAGERVGRKEIAELGHGGLCLKCETCRYPVCPFGK
jgi:molybdenum cofactor synthesis domain-containing protein